MAPSATDYAKKKNAELEELLKERGLAHTGKKAELVARLQAHDAEQATATTAPATGEDEIDWDDEAPATTTAPAANPPPASATGGTGQPANPTAVPNQVPAIDPSKTSDLTVTKSTENPADNVADISAEASATAPDFTSNLPATSVDAEIEKRKKRAARFGIPESDAAATEATKSLERAKRFGTTTAEGAGDIGVGALDRALPERERKRGRAGDEGDRGAKRRDSRRRDVKKGGNTSGTGGKTEGATPGGGKKFSKDQADKDKLASEARKKRFASQPQVAA